MYIICLKVLVYHILLITTVLCLYGDQAEADTDEVFAQLTLMPETNVS